MENTRTVTHQQFRNRCRFDGWRVIAWIAQNVAKVKIGRKTWEVTISDMPE